MKKADLDKYRKKLLQLKSQIRNDVDGVLGNAFNGDQGSQGDEGDLGSENADQALALNLTENDTQTLRMIDSALRRIEEGTYGVCVGSGARIPKARLDAIPYTPYCVAFAEKVESGEVQVEI